MTTAVTYKSGVFGPSERLLYELKNCMVEEVNILMEMLENTFHNLSILNSPVFSVELSNTKYKEDFNSFAKKIIETQQDVSPVELLKTDFFKNMQSQKTISKDIHEKMLVIVPNIRMVARDEVPHKPGSSEEENAVNEWCALFIESYMTEEQIISQYDVHTKQNEGINAERGRIGKLLYTAVIDKKFTEKDLDYMLAFLLGIDGIFSTDHTDHPDLVRQIATDYTNLFTMNTNDPEGLKKNVTNMLDTVFRAKVFHKNKSLYYFYLI